MKWVLIKDAAVKLKVNWFYTQARAAAQKLIGAPGIEEWQKKGDEKAAEEVAKKKAAQAAAGSTP